MKSLYGGTVAPLRFSCHARLSNLIVVRHLNHRLPFRLPRALPSLFAASPVVMIRCHVSPQQLRVVRRTPFDEHDERSADVFVRGEKVMPFFAQSLLPRHPTYVGLCWLAVPWLSFKLV